MAAVGRGVLVLAGEEAALFALGRAQVEVALHGQQAAGGQHLLRLVELVAGHGDGDAVRIAHLVKIGVDGKAVGQRLVAVVGDLVVQAQALGGEGVGELERAGEGIAREVLLVRGDGRHARAPRAVRRDAVVVGEGLVDHHAVQIARLAVLPDLAGVAAVGVLAVARAVREGEEDRHAVGGGTLQRLIRGHEHLPVLVDGGIELEAAARRDEDLRARALQRHLHRAGVHPLFVCLEVLHDRTLLVENALS